MLLILVGLLASPLDVAWALAERASESRDETLRAEADAALAAVGGGDDPRARAAFKRGWLAERFARPVDALAHFRDAARIDPDGRFANRAHRRVRALSRHEGPDAALRARFERRIAQMKPEDARAVGADVESMLAEARTPTLRAELLMWLANEAYYRRGDPAGGRARYLDAARVEGLPDPLWRRAVSDAVLTVEGTEGLDAIETVIRSRPETADGWARLMDEIEDRRQRRWARGASVLSLAVLAVVFLFRRGWRALRPDAVRAWRPWRGGAFVAYAFGAAGFLADRYEGGYGLPFLACGIVSLAVYLVAGAAQHAGAERSWGVGIAGAAATLGACFLILARLRMESVVGL
jgi:hypothetical protein